MHYGIRSRRTERERERDYLRPGWTSRNPRGFRSQSRSKTRRRCPWKKGRRRERGWLRAVAAELPVGLVRTLIGGCVCGGLRRTVNLVPCASGPPTYLYTHWRQGPTTMDRVGRPRLGRDKGLRTGRWARTWERSIQHSPPRSRLYF
jgi:hypothetical protein